MKPMTDIADIQRLLNQNDQRSQTVGSNILIIASADDQQKILSRFKSETAEALLFDLQDKMTMRTYPNNGKARKRSTSELLDEVSKDETKKKRKGDLTCVICGGTAFGYNFHQITCESCKAFFRRNALHQIEETKCLKKLNHLNTIQCDIRDTIKHKCQRCRLLKCFQLGMRKDRILTPEEKLSKQQRLEKNRRLRLIHISANGLENRIKTETPEQSPLQPIPAESKAELIDIPSPKSSHLTQTDHDCLNYIRNAYSNAIQSIPPVSSSMPLELAPDKMSAYMNTLDLQNYAALKIIHFIRQIPEFEQIDESDRLVLTKYHLPATSVVHYALTFDPTRDIFYHDLPTDAVSPAEEAFAQHYKSLSILCYGYELNRSFMSLIRSIHGLIQKDSTLMQLLMLNVIFLKGISATDDPQPSLRNYQSTFDAHSKYADLLFRYLIETFAADTAVKKMMQITTIFIEVQRLVRDFQEFVKTRVDLNYVNPLMKSFLNLT